MHGWQGHKDWMQSYRIIQIPNNREIRRVLCQHPGTALFSYLAEVGIGLFYACQYIFLNLLPLYKWISKHNTQHTHTHTIWYMLERIYRGFLNSIRLLLISATHHIHSFSFPTRDFPILHIIDVHIPLCHTTGSFLLFKTFAIKNDSSCLTSCYHQRGDDNFHFCSLFFFDNEDLLHLYF